MKNREAERETLVLVKFPPASFAGDALQATIRRIDRFGNLITNCAARMFDTWTGGAKQLTVPIANGELDLLVASVYNDAPPDALIALIDSAAVLEIAVANGNAAQRLGITDSGGSIRLVRQ